MLVPQCPSFDHLVRNGVVSYSRQDTQLQSTYSIGSIATVTCDPGFRGGGFSTCTSGGVWSSYPPACKGIAIYHHYYSKYESYMHAVQDCNSIRDSACRF